MRDVSMEPWRRLRGVRLAGRRWKTSWPIMEPDSGTTKQALTLDYSVIPANKVNPIWEGFPETGTLKNKDKECFNRQFPSLLREKLVQTLIQVYLRKESLSSLLWIFFSCIIRFCWSPPRCIEFSFPFYIVLVRFKLKIYIHGLLSYLWSKCGVILKLISCIAKDWALAELRLPCVHHSSQLGKEAPQMAACHS